MGKFFLGLVVALSLVIAWKVYRVFGPVTYSDGTLAEFCEPAYEMAGFELKGEDRIETGGRTHGWLDSSTFCRLKTTPGRARAFKDMLRAAHVPDPRYPVQPEDIFSCEYFSYSGAGYPKWWQGGDRPGAACYGISKNPQNPRGVRLVIFEDEGLIFAEKWRS